MYAKHCTKADLENAAGLDWKIQVEDRGSKGLMFTLRHFDSSNSKYDHGMKVTPGWDGSPGRKTSSLCLHEHYRYFERLFTIAPDAVVTSSRLGKVTHTRTTLHENYRDMQGWVMRRIDGLLLDDCCNCPQEWKP
jgi:hypothetical protein